MFHKFTKEIVTSIRNGQKSIGQSVTQHVLPSIPYPVAGGIGKAVTPENLDYHYNKHHNAYVTNLNKLVPGTPYEGLSVEEIMILSHGKPADKGIFNNAAQVFNHAFYFNGMLPAGSQPSSAVMGRINDSFGDFEGFKKEFSAKAATLFGSGWAWLVEDNTTKKLSVMQTSNADIPFVENDCNPLMVCDVWEHAYYLTSQNRRPEYIDNFFGVINWAFVEENMNRQY